MYFTNYTAPYCKLHHAVQYTALYTTLHCTLHHAVHYITLYTAPGYNLNHTVHWTLDTVHCITLHCTAPKWSMLHSTTPNCSTAQEERNKIRSLHYYSYTALHCSTLLYTTLHYFTLLNTALHRSLMRFTALHYIYLLYIVPHFLYTYLMSHYSLLLYSFWSDFSDRFHQFTPGAHQDNTFQCPWLMEDIWL